MPHKPVDQETIYLLNKRVWLDRHIEKAMRKRRYDHLPPVDDLPKWRSLAADIIGGTLGGAFMLALLMAVGWVTNGGHF